MKDKKYYGTCNVKYDEGEMSVYIECYKAHVTTEYGNFVKVYNCKDLITGTPLNTIPAVYHESNLYDAAWKEQIKKGHLIAENVVESSKEEMLNVLKSLNDEEIENYVKNITELKSKYLEAKKQANHDKKEMIKSAKRKDKNFESEIGRIKGIARRILKR